MLKMVIVEDERLEREGLVDFFDWNSFGIEIVGVGSDGIEGMELAEREQPDIIITDIKMPGMNGIEMCKKIRSFLPKAKIIILSGHDDFNYAKAAIGFRANAYVLKPIIDEEIMGTIQSVVNECIYEQKKIEEEMHTKEKLMKEYDSAKGKIFRDLIEGRLKKSEFEERMDYYGIQFTNKGKFLVFNLKFMEETVGYLDKFSGEFISKVKEYVLFFHKMENQEIRFLCQFENKKYDIALNIVMEQFLKIFDKDIFNMVCALGCEVDSLYDVHESYKSAEEALKYGMFWGINGIISYKDILTSSSTISESIGKFIIQGNKFSKSLIHAVSSSDEVKASEILKEMFDYINSHREIGIDYIKNYLQNVVYEITLIEYNIERKVENNKKINDGFDGISTSDTLKAIQGYVQDVTEYVISILEEKRSNKDENVIKNVISLVEERYMQDINLRVIAAEVFFSPNYLGTIFKKFIGKSFNDYLSEYRMEKAKELLTNTNKKVSEVAKQVGISNTSYFSILFKNFYGMSPKEYQEMSIRR